MSYPPPQPVPSGPVLRPNRVVGLVASVLVVVAVAGSVAATVVDWTAVAAVAPGSGSTDADLAALDSTLLQVFLLGLGLHLVAGIAVIVWLRRARANAEQLYPAGQHRYGAGWAIGAWFVPIANLVVPLKIVAEVWTASRSGLGPEAAELSRQPTDPRVGWWWACWLGAWAVSWISGRVPGSSVGFGLLSTLSAVLEIGAAVLLIVIIRRISTWQGV